MKKTNSIIEEALIEASQLEEAVREVGREVLATTMRHEMESVIKSSLTEDEEVGLPTNNPMDDQTPMGDDMSPEMSDEPDEISTDEMSDDIDNPADDEVMDLTNHSDSDVIKVFKSLGPDDSIEVVRNGNEIKLTDGDKSYILQMEGVEELTDEMLDEWLDDETYEDIESLDLDDDDVEYELDLDDDDEDYELDENVSEEVMYEIELDEDEDLVDEDMDEDEDDEKIKEASRTFGFGSKDGSRGLRKAISPNRDYTYNSSKIKENEIKLKNKVSLLESELNLYKEKNNEYKDALSTLKGKMNEMAVYYTNLSLTNKLFTEQTTTKKEKLDILKRFDDVKTISESKNLFNTLSDEYSRKKPIGNLKTLSEGLEKTISTSSSKLTESVVYEDPKIKEIKDLMSRMKK